MGDSEEAEGSHRQEEVYDDGESPPLPPPPIASVISRSAYSLLRPKPLAKLPIIREPLSWTSEEAYVSSKEARTSAQKLPSITLTTLKERMALLRDKKSAPQKGRDKKDEPSKYFPVTNPIEPCQPTFMPDAEEHARKLTSSEVEGIYDEGGSPPPPPTVLSRSAYSLLRPKPLAKIPIIREPLSGTSRTTLNERLAPLLDKKSAPQKGRDKKDEPSKHFPVTNPIEPCQPTFMPDAEEHARKFTSSEVEASDGEDDCSSLDEEIYDAGCAEELYSMGSQKKEGNASSTLPIAIPDNLLPSTQKLAAYGEPANNSGPDDIVTAPMADKDSLTTGAILSNISSHILRELQAKYFSLQDRQPGVCYSTNVAAIGEFDGKGGVLTLVGTELIRLRIPAGALDGIQLIYLVVQYEEDTSGGQTATMSPVVECGPDGTQFQVPVELTLPNAAIDTDIIGLSQSSKGDGWSEDGTKIKCIKENTATLLVTHFTRFKLSTTSRIPVLVRNGAGKSGKRLSVTVFTRGPKARVYFTLAQPNSALENNIDTIESQLKFARDSQWKEFKFLVGCGGLNVGANSNGKSLKSYTFPEDVVMGRLQDSWEFITDKDNMLIDFIINQPEAPAVRTQFSVELLRQPPLPIYPPLPRIHEIQHSLTQSHLDIQHVEPLRLSAEDISTFSLTPELGTASVKEPVEDCDHAGGACGCINRKIPEECDLLWLGPNDQPENEQDMNADYLEKPFLKGPKSLSMLSKTCTRVGATSEHITTVRERAGLRGSENRLPAEGCTQASSLSLSLHLEPA